jgi:biotin carboxylase
LKKTILIISGGTEAVPGIQLAKKLGLKVVVSDADLNAPGFEFADHKLIASTYDVDATVIAATKFHKNVNPIDGVICIASDVPLTVAKVADELKLPGISIASAKLAIDKLAMKNCFLKDKVSVPWFTSIESAIDLKNKVKVKGFPLVIKPVDSRGSRGVLRLLEETDLEWAYNTAKEYSPTGRVMLEKFMTGPQVSTESIVINGSAYTIGFSDRNYEFLDRYAPHIIENGGQLPSHLDYKTKKAVESLIQISAKSMGIKDGIVKGDIVITNGKPYVIELAARLSGGYFCTHEIPLNTGVDLVGAAIRQAIGEEINLKDLQCKYNRPVAQRYMFPNPGKVSSVDLPEWVLNDPEVSFFELRINKGDIVKPILNHPSRAGVVIATGSKISEAINKAKNVVSSIKIVTETI